MKGKTPYVHAFILVINIAFAVYLIYTWSTARPPIPTIPASLITGNNLIKTEIQKLAQESGNRGTILALMSSEAGICAENNIASLLRRLDKENFRPYILFSSAMSEQDISIFRENFKLDFEVMRMNFELDAYWGQLSEKYKTPGVVILSGRNGLFASSNLTEIKKAIAAY